MKSILLGLSGGVDSTAAAIILQEQGWNVIALNYVLTEESQASQNMAKRLGIEHHTLDLREEFQRFVIDHMVSEYEQGRTPNPCVRCNPTIKWPYLAEYADRLGIEYIATGHYARVMEKDGMYMLRKAADSGKDQSYFMYRIGNEYLQRAVFPLGDITRAQAEEICHSRGLLPESEHRSSDLCFLSGGKLRDFLAEKLPALPGDVWIPDQGKIREHSNIRALTVGQRRGLSTAWKYPLYVISVDIPGRRAVAGPKELLLCREFSIGNTFWNGAEPSTDREYTVKIRNTHPGTACEIQKQGEVFRISMKQDQYAITPGQSAVIYDGDIVLGGGIIRQA